MADEPGTSAASGDPDEHAPFATIGRGAAWRALLALIGAVVAGLGAGTALAFLGAPGDAVMLGFYVALDVVLVVAAVALARRFGTGRGARADLGLRLSPPDLWRGAVVFLVAFVASLVAVTPFAESERFDRTTHELVERAGTGSGLAVFAVVGILGAPLVEELFFRGLLLRSLSSRMRFGWANLVQTLVFTTVHIDATAGAGNALYASSVGAYGLVAGWAAHRYRSLGPPIVAHAMRNALAVAVVASGT